MKAAAKFGLLSLMALSALSEPTQEVSSPTDYKLAIDSAVVSAENDSRAWMRTCVRQWVPFSKERNAIFRELHARRSADLSILLEVGNSGFPKYDFVFVADDFIRTSLGRSEGKLADSEVAQLTNAVTGKLDEMVGSAVAQSFDSDCYFLTVRQGSRTKQVAIYGSAESTLADQIVREMLSLGR